MMRPPLLAWTVAVVWSALPRFLFCVTNVLERTRLASGALSRILGLPLFAPYRNFCDWPRLASADPPELAARWKQGWKLASSPLPRDQLVGASFCPPRCKIRLTYATNVTLPAVVSNEEKKKMMKISSFGTFYCPRCKIRPTYVILPAAVSDRKKISLLALFHSTLPPPASFSAAFSNLSKAVTSCYLIPPTFVAAVAAAAAAPAVSCVPPALDFGGQDPADGASRALPWAWALPPKRRRRN